MQASFQTNRPEEIEFTMTITMPMSDWLMLQDQLAGKWPASELSRKITDLVFQAQSKFVSAAKGD